MGLPSNYTEMRWGRDGDELVVGLAQSIPDSLLVKLLEDEHVNEIFVQAGNYSTVKYSMDKFRKGDLAPLNLISEELVTPLREIYQAHNLGRIAFDPTLRDIQKEGPLFGDKKA